MSIGNGRTLAIACWIALQVLALPTESQAGPLWNWLFGRRPTTCQPVATTAYFGAAACDPCAQPSMVQQSVVNYVPQTAFRTTWVKVPVTNYRPVASVDPCTGCGVTAMRPCTTAVWQARRMPVVSYRPTIALSTAGACCAPALQTSIGTCGACCAPAQQTYSSPAVQAVAPGGCSGCSAGSAITTPTYSSPITTPSYSLPQTPPATTTPFTPSPADQPPSLEPGALQGGVYQGSSTRYSPSTTTASGNMSSQSTSSQPTRGEQQPANIFNVRPVPDPEAQQPSEKPNGAPRLLNPRERTAAWPIQGDWAITPVVWPQAASEQLAASSTTPAVHFDSAPAKTPMPEDADQWDASGWTSIRP